MGSGFVRAMLDGFSGGQSMVLLGKKNKKNPARALGQVDDPFNPDEERRRLQRARRGSQGLSDESLQGSSALGPTA